MDRSAAVVVRIPYVLRNCCGGETELLVAAANVRQLLNELERHYLSLYRSVCDETGRVRRHVNFFVNSSHLRDLHDLDTALTPGDVVTILPAVSGG